VCWVTLVQRGASQFVLHIKYSPGDQIKNERGWDGARIGGTKVHTWLRWGNVRERYHLEDLVVFERIILK
jgi:hypothetical protein